MTAGKKDASRELIQAFDLQFVRYTRARAR